MRQGGPSSLPRAAAPSFAPRAHGPTPRPDRIPLDAEARSAAEGGGAAGRSALHLLWPPGAPEVPGSPLPPLFVTARLPVCGRRTWARFPGREAAEGREFLADSPALAGSASASRTRTPPPAWEPSCPAPEGAAGPSAPPGWGSALLGPGEPAGRGAAGREISFRPFGAELPPGPEPRAEGANRGALTARLSPEYDSGCPEAGPFRTL